MPLREFVPNPPVSVTKGTHSGAQRVVEIAADHRGDALHVAADPRGGPIGPVINVVDCIPQVDGHAGGVGRIVQRAVQSACDAAQKLSSRAEDECVIGAVAAQFSRRAVVAGALDIEGVCGPFRDHIPGDAGAIEVDRHTMEAVGGVELNRGVLDREDIGHEGLAVDDDGSAAAGESDRVAGGDLPEVAVQEVDDEEGVVGVGSHVAFTIGDQEVDGSHRGDRGDARGDRAEGVVADIVRAAVGPGDRRAQRIAGVSRADVHGRRRGENLEGRAGRRAAAGWRVRHRDGGGANGREVARRDRRRHFGRRHVGRRQRGGVPVDDRLH